MDCVLSKDNRIDIYQICSFQFPPYGKSLSWQLFCTNIGTPNTNVCFSIWFCPKLDSKVEISSIFVACLENLNFNYNLESRSGIQNPEKISLCRLLSAGTSTIGLSIVAARKFQPALESTWHRLWTHSWFLITSRQVHRFPIYCILRFLNKLRRDSMKIYFDN